MPRPGPFVLLWVLIAVGGCAHRGSGQNAGTPQVRLIGAAAQGPPRRPATTARADPPRASPPVSAAEIGSLRSWSRQERSRIDRVQHIVRAAAAAHGLPADLINGVIWVESKFERRARGRKGPQGLMQLMPRTARYVARQLKRKYRPYSADFNIHAGSYYLAKMLRSFNGDRDLALAAYNRGPGIVRGWLRDGLPLADQSRRYIAKVLSAADAFRQRLRPRFTNTLSMARLSGSVGEEQVEEPFVRSIGGDPR